MTCFLEKGGILADSNLMDINVEGLNDDFMNGLFINFALVVPHCKGSPRQEDHIRRSLFLAGDLAKGC